LREFLKHREVLKANGNSLISKGKGHPETCHDWQKEDMEIQICSRLNSAPY